jgi:hypothetical protein
LISKDSGITAAGFLTGMEKGAFVDIVGLSNVRARIDLHRAFVK